MIASTTNIFTNKMFLFGPTLRHKWLTVPKRVIVYNLSLTIFQWKVKQTM
jgi:hypothetical protein